MIVLDLLSEIFILIILGILLKRKEVLDDHTINQLTDFIVKIVIPCAVISSFEMRHTYKIIISAGIVLLISIGIQFFYFIFYQFIM